MPRIVITGLGLVTAIGNNTEESWRAFLNGVDGSNELRAFDTSLYRIHRACEVKNFDCDLPANRRSIAIYNTVYKYVYAAAREALNDSGLLQAPGFNPERVGVALGTLASELPVYEYHLRPEPVNKAAGFTPEVALTYPIAFTSSAIAEDFGFEGPCSMHIDACSSGNHTIAYAYDLIQSGRVDAMVVGGGEPTPQTGFTHFHNLRALAPDRCQPFDKNRQGLMLGEGAGVLVMETYEAASRRGAPIYAEVLSYGLSCDAYHMTAPHPEGDGARRAIAAALENARLSPDSIDYVSAHGTGTPLNDVTETMALKAVLGERAYRVPTSSIKSMIGHTMGAASAIESAVCCLALRDQIAPPTINYETPDPGCDLDYVPNQARELKMKIVLNNSFAFGGNNAVIIFGKVR